VVLTFVVDNAWDCIYILNVLQSHITNAIPKALYYLHEMS